MSDNYGSTSKSAKYNKEDEKNSSSQNTDQSSTLNISEAALHSPWGISLGIVAKRAGKECRYGAIDTTWISKDRYSWRQVPKDDFEADSGMFYKIKKKEDEKENDKSNSDAAKSETEPNNGSKPKKTDDDVLSEDEDDLSYGWYEIRLYSSTMGEAGSSLDALNAVLN